MEAGQNCLKSGAVLAIISGLQRVRFSSPGLMPVTALEFARQRFAEDGLQGQFDLGDFTSLPYADNQFDIAFERAALSQTPKLQHARLWLKYRGCYGPVRCFMLNYPSDRVTSRGTKTEDGLMIDVKGPYSGVGQIGFLFKK